MFLSRLILNLHNSDARRDLAAGYELHRTLTTRAFAEHGITPGRMLFRVEPTSEAHASGGPIVLVQSSQNPPSLGPLSNGYCLRIDGPKRFDPVIIDGMQLAFRLVANPVRRIAQKDADGQVIESESGHRRHRRRALLDAESQRAWLDRQGEAGGFRPHFVSIAPLPSPRAPNAQKTALRKSAIPHVLVRFDGTLEVTDPEAFVETLRRGIGPAKAFGCGLLSVRRL